MVMADWQQSKEWDRTCAIVAAWKGGKEASRIHPYRRHRRAAVDVELGPKESVRELAALFGGTGPAAATRRVKR